MLTRVDKVDACLTRVLFFAVSHWRPGTVRPGFPWNRTLRRWRCLARPDGVARRVLPSTGSFRNPTAISGETVRRWPFIRLRRLFLFPCLRAARLDVFQSVHRSGCAMASLADGAAPGFRLIGGAVVASAA